MKLNLVLTEWYTSTSWRKLEIDTDDYPELAGMTKEQAQAYNLVLKAYVKKYPNIKIKT